MFKATVCFSLCREELNDADFVIVIMVGIQWPIGYSITTPGISAGICKIYFFLATFE